MLRGLGSKAMEVSVTTLSGSTVTIRLEENASVTELVNRASHALGMPVCGLASRFSSL